jgi:hypothetical protein
MKPYLRPIIKPPLRRAQVPAIGFVNVTMASLLDVLSTAAGGGGGLTKRALGSSGLSCGVGMSNELQDPTWKKRLGFSVSA